MEIKGSNVDLTQKIKEDSAKQLGQKLAKEMIIFADDNSSAVSKAEFQAKLDKMEKLSTQDLITFIHSFDKDESVIELIVDEVGSNKQERKDACKKVLSALIAKAEELGIDVEDFREQFIKELNHQFNSWGTVNTEKLDSIINAITQSIENRQNFTPEDVQIVQNTPAEVGQGQSNDIIENRLEKAYSAFGERVGEDGEMTTRDKDGNLYNGQMQRDGIAADIADGLSRIWGSENTAAKVREDLKATNEQLQQLKEAKLQGEDAYKAKFKEIFGVEYDYANIVAYQKAEQTYINASASREFEMAFNRNLRTLLSPAPLREEYRYDSPDPSTSMVVATLTASKEQVYSREFNSLAGFIGENGADVLNKAFEEKGVADGTIEEKFEVLKQIAQTLSKQLHSSTLEAGGGKEFSEVQAMYDNSYKAAYGVENDIMKRVTDYNVSQEVGGAFTKAGAILVTTLATAGFGGGLVATAAAASIATVGAEVIDRGTSGKALDALREQGLGEYLDVVGDDVDWESTFKQAAMSGAAVLIGGGVAQGVMAVMKGSSSVAQFAAMLGADVATDATLEFLTTKQITWQGMVFTVLLSTIGNGIQIKQMKDAVDPAKIAQKYSVTDIEQQLADIEVKRTIAQNADEIASLATQRQAYESALTKKGLEMLEADGFTVKFIPAECDHDSGTMAHIKIENAKGDYFYLKGKNAIFEEDLQAIGREYAKLRTSGADMSALVARFSVAKYQYFWDNIEQAFKGARFYDLLSQNSPTAYKFNNTDCSIKHIAQMLDAFDANPEKAIKMIDDAYVAEKLRLEAFEYGYSARNKVKGTLPEMERYMNLYEDYSAQEKRLFALGDFESSIAMSQKAISTAKKAIGIAKESSRLSAPPQSLLKPQTADNISGQGISFRQAAGQPDYSATRIEWGKTVEETIALNKKNGVNLELVKGDDGQDFFGIKDIWTDGYHRVDRNSVVMHYGDYAPTPENYVAANPEWVKANANPDGTVKDCAVVANDVGAQILENSYVTADGQKIYFPIMEPGTKVHKDPNATVNAVAYDSPKTLHTLEGDITTDVTMGDVDGNVYNNFKQLKKQITKGQLVANEADLYSAKFIELIKAGKDDEAIALLKWATKMSQ